MSSTTMIILSAFVVYLLFMIVIGVVYMKKTNNSEDYFLGGRGLNAWVAALSAQASDMSGWLLMGLPGAIYSLGTGQIWIAVGLFIGTVLNWVCISHRLRKYTIAANNSLTIPAYLENRFQDKKRILLLLSSIVIVIFSWCIQPLRLQQVVSFLTPYLELITILHWQSEQQLFSAIPLWVDLWQYV